MSGRDRAALEAAVAPYRENPALKWESSEPSLEDVFIDLMGRAGTISNECARKENSAEDSGAAPAR